MTWLIYNLVFFSYYKINTKSEAKFSIEVFPRQSEYDVENCRTEGGADQRRSEFNQEANLPTKLSELDSQFPMMNSLCLSHLKDTHSLGKLIIT
jgi:hypothetical protein